MNLKIAFVLAAIFGLFQIFGAVQANVQDSLRDAADRQVVIVD